jgi:hypothetical protein
MILRMLQLLSLFSNHLFFTFDIAITSSLVVPSATRSWREPEHRLHCFGRIRPQHFFFLCMLHCHYYTDWLVPQTMKCIKYFRWTTLGMLSRFAFLECQLSCGSWERWPPSIHLNDIPDAIKFGSSCRRNHFLDAFSFAGSLLAFPGGRANLESHQCA